MKMKMFPGLIFFLMIFLTGCATTLYKPLYLHKDYYNNELKEITVLLAIDERVDRSTNLDMFKKVTNPIAKSLRKKKYEVNAIQNCPEIMNTLEIDITDADSTFYNSFRKYGRFVVFPILLDCSASLTFGSTGNAELSVYLIDTEKKCLVWKEKGVGSAGQGGLLGMAMVGTMASEALFYAIINTMGSIPEMGKPFRIE